MFIKISGIRGSGKTTITPLFVSLLEEYGYLAERVYGAKMMADFLGISVEELSHTSEEKRKKARVMVYEKLYQEDLLNPKIRVRDGHFALVKKRTNGQIEVNISDPIRGDKSQLKAIYLLEPPIAVLLARRQLDLDKRADRNVADLALLEQELYWERLIAKKQAQEIGIPLHIFDNLSTPEQTCQKLWQQLQLDLKGELVRCRKEF
jgi:adenylate kinase